MMSKLRHIALILFGALLLCLTQATETKANIITDAYDSAKETVEDHLETRDSSDCQLDRMTCIYLDKSKCKEDSEYSAKSDAPDTEESCWYCKIVIILVNAYLKVAKDALSATIFLGKIVLKAGFLIWLAYYILQQVSSMEQIAPGKMLQEILIMGFKVALAYLILEDGTQFISNYYINPIVSAGVDYGNEIFKGMNPT